MKNLAASFLSVFLFVACGNAMAINSTLIWDSIDVDVTGRVLTATFIRTSGPNQLNTDVAVEVPEGWVAVGGGATGSNSDPGALITASYPASNLSAWIVSTKDHIRPHPHTVEAYAIGMIFLDAGNQWVNMRDLVSRGDIRIFSRESSYSQAPDSSASVPWNYIMVGGGAKVNITGVGNLLTATYPYNPVTWRAMSHDHTRPDNSSIISYAIGVKNSIANIGAFSNAINSAGSATAQHPLSSVNANVDYALTTCGAEVVNPSGVGSLLWKIKPKTQLAEAGCTVSSKDHLTPDPANINSYSIGLRIH